MTPDLPSGAQYELRHGDQHAVAVAVGGGLRAYAVDGRPVLDGYDAAVMADGARGQTLVPWPNRVRDGQWTWAGEQRQLALTEPAQHNAIHGLARWLTWTCERQDEAAVELSCRIAPQPGYAWPLDVRNLHRLDDDGLTVTTTVVNRGAEPAPVAVGFHPYLSPAADRIDAATLHLPASEWLPTGDQQIPTGRQPVEGTPYDFRTPRRIDDLEIDYAFAGLDRDPDGRFRLRLTAPDGRVVALWLGPAYEYVEVFTGDALPDPSRRRRGLGVEPMTAPPNAFATGESLVVLSPGETWTGEWGIEPWR